MSKRSPLEDAAASRGLGMFDRGEINRIIDLGHLSYTGAITTAQKGELRELLARYSPAVQDVDWPGVIHFAEFLVGAYEVAHEAATGEVA